MRVDSPRRVRATAGCAHYDTPRAALAAGSVRLWPLKSSPLNNPESESRRMDVTQEVLRVVDEVLSLNGRATTFSRSTPLLGAIPELDSMAVVTLITTLEDRFGLIVDDDEVDGATFATVGTLVDFVAGKVAA